MAEEIEKDLQSKPQLMSTVARVDCWQKCNEFESFEEQMEDELKVPEDVHNYKHLQKFNGNSRCQQCSSFKIHVLGRLLDDVDECKINYVQESCMKMGNHVIQRLKLLNCYDVKAQMRGVVMDCERFTTFGLCNVKNESKNSMFLLRVADDGGIALMLSEVTQIEQQKMLQNVENVSIKWYEDHVNKSIPFTAGLANVWVDSHHHHKSMTVTLDDLDVFHGKLEFYELKNEARVIYHCFVEKDAVVNSEVINQVCHVINRKIIYKKEWRHILEELQHLGKKKLDKIQLSLLEPKQSELRSNCYHCGSSLLKQKKKCRGCKIVFYCSRHCQKKDWCLHRQFCKNKRLVMDDEKNMRYLHDWM